MSKSVVRLRPREQTSREATILLYAPALDLRLQKIIKRASPGPSGSDQQERGESTS